VAAKMPTNVKTRPHSLNECKHDARKTHHPGAFCRKIAVRRPIFGDFRAPPRVKFLSTKRAVSFFFSKKMRTRGDAVESFQAESLIIDGKVVTFVGG
jgi:hypothetical protein